MLSLFGNKAKKVAEHTASSATPVSKPAELGAVEIKKADADEQLVFGEVFAPGFPDSQGHFMSAAEIRNMAYRFMKKNELQKVDVGHSRKESGSYIVESFIARDDDPTFIPGSWVIGVHIPNSETWSLVKSGELNGFSLDGFGLLTPTQFEIDMPELLKGETTLTEDHVHEFEVSFDASGKFLGGKTLPAEDGHWHSIVKGTATEDTNGHSHRFSFVEGVLHAQALV